MNLQHPEISLSCPELSLGLPRGSSDSQPNVQIPHSSFGIKSSFSSFDEFGNCHINCGVPGNWIPHLFHLLGDDFFSAAQQEIIFSKV